MDSRNTSNIEISDEGDLVVYESSADRERRERLKRIENIRDQISDPATDPADISRAIAVEIAYVAGNMVSSETIMATTQLKAFSEQVKALRELGKQLTDAEILSKKDILNFDGPKFAFVLETVVNMFVKSMKEAGCAEDMRTSILKHYRDEMQMNEARIRKDTQSVGEVKRRR
jgi:hypothetical protein